jgi:RNA polymerase sigma-70 factor (ECF subfamily)
MDKLPHWANLLASLERQDLDQTVRESVARLPPKYRDALLLYYFLDKDVGETAQVLGLASGTVKARLHRGREMLRQRMAALAPVGPAPEEA